MSKQEISGNQNELERNGNHKNLTKRISLGLAGVIVAGGIGVATYNFERNGSEAQNANKTTVSETVKPGETTKPATTETPAQKTETELNQELNKELAAAPELAGAKKVLQDNGLGKEVTYVAENGNAYGVEANKFVGVYREKVTLDNKEVGGVALVPKVVEKLLNNSLKTNKWMLFVPADISEIKDSEAKITIELADGVNSRTKKVNPNRGLEIDFDNKNVSISSQVVKGMTDGVLNQISVFSFDNNTELPGVLKMGLFQTEANQDGLGVFGYFSFSKGLQGDKIPFGTKLTETNSHIYEMLTVKSGAPDLDEAHVLKVDNSPVFVIDQ